MPTEFFPPLSSKIESLLRNVDEVSEVRRQLLRALVANIQTQLSAALPVQLQFVCTHNSRRSQFGQVWAAAAAAYSGVTNVTTYSGGTEATACNPRTVAALRRAGFIVEPAAEQQSGDNIRYEVKFSENHEALICFSKVFDHAENPSEKFTAVMTCGEADEACPVIPGAKRISLLYEDPKVADDTSEESRRYDERSDQIGTEMLWVFREVALATR